MYMSFHTSHMSRGTKIVFTDTLVFVQFLFPNGRKVFK